MKKLLVTPYGLVMITVAMSFIAWLVPDFGFLRKGFDQPEDLVSPGLIVVICWYGAIIGLSYFGFKIGQSMALRTDLFNRYTPLDDTVTYAAISAVSLSGVIYLDYYLISKSGLSQIIEFINEGQANLIKETLYESYSIGVLSLRYATTLSGALALYRIVSGISRSWIDLINIGLLLNVALISSRLSLINTALIAAILFFTNFPNVRIQWFKILMAGAVIFLILGVLNSTRNRNFYEEQGNSGFFDSATSECLSYLGAPFQGSLAAGNHLDLWLDGTYLNEFSGIEDSLTTNSALANIPFEYGSKFLLVALLICWGCAFFIGFLSRQHGNHLMLVSCILLYCFSEIWRTFIFLRGIISTLLIISVVIPCAVTFFRMNFRNSSKKVV